MEKLEKRMKASSENRQLNMIEEVQYKARQLVGPDGNHLKKWQQKMLSLRSIEDKQTKGFRQELERRREDARQREEMSKSVAKEQLYRHQEEMQYLMQRSAERMLREEQEIQESAD